MNFLSCTMLHQHYVLWHSSHASRYSQRQTGRNFQTCLTKQNDTVWILCHVLLGLKTSLLMEGWWLPRVIHVELKNETLAWTLNSSILFWCFSSWLVEFFVLSRDFSFENGLVNRCFCFVQPSLHEIHIFHFARICSWVKISNFL